MNWGMSSFKMHQFVSDPHRKVVHWFYSDKIQLNPAITDRHKPISVYNANEFTFPSTFFSLFPILAIIQSFL